MKTQPSTKYKGEDDVPCYMALYDSDLDLYWAVPISSKVPKYKGIYEDKVKKYKRCDTIVFGEVLGYEKAFLIQNMTPVKKEHIAKQYTDKFGVSVGVSTELKKEIKTKVKKVLALHKQGKKVVFTDIDKMLEKIL